MKKFIIYVLFVFICAFSGFFIYKSKLSSQYEESAVPYIKQVLPLISTWDPSLARDYMAPEVIERVSDVDLETLMQSLSQMGDLQSIDKIAFKNKTSGEHTTQAHLPLVTYDLTTHYSSGEVSVTISLLDKGESYEVYHFNFQSEALAQ